MSHPSLRMRILRHTSPGLRLRLKPPTSRPVPSFLKVGRVSLQTSRAVSTSTSTSTTGDASSSVTRFKSVLWGTSLSFFAVFAYLYATDTRAGLHQWLVPRALRLIYPDAEEAHHAGTLFLKTLYSFGLHPRERSSKARDAEGVDLGVVVFGQKLQNPIGTSAGIDKLAELPDPLMALGPAIVEVGGATPLAQEGNPKPRVFRLPAHRALINRYGLNGLGADNMAKRLRERVRSFAYNNGLGAGEEAVESVLNGGAGVPPGSLVEGKLLAVQVAKNKDTKDEDIEAVKRDYVYCVERLAPYADILVVNVSSPNTPGLRTLQRVEPLTRILEGVVGAARASKRKNPPKVMVKVSPDEDEDQQMEGIVEAVWKSGVDGVIVGNTTKRRDNLISQDIKLTPKEKRILNEQGGFSGPQMFERTKSLVKRYRTLLDQGPPPETTSEPEKSLASPSTMSEKANAVKESVKKSVAELAESGKHVLPTSHEQKVIFATGGITNGKQALEVLNAGANVAQIYTAMIYGGAGTVSRIKKEMKEEILRQSK
ncbi:hypothetical protein HYFRA_00005412 [Hymenoscyphus fraxineus]|uniref:Dihydroorotate dehydrogenase (quinone), mitochondrial n=1 Tax=Hymenoscyphus fraxineus TaxID=746836 RepID=A0A9N9KU84_9HELO|nr:hypothetical protein HYFRA_00005412 [Hymenoscyphus fraxineus]